MCWCLNVTIMQIFEIVRMSFVYFSEKKNFLTVFISVKSSIMCMILAIMFYLFWPHMIFVDRVISSIGLFNFGCVVFKLIFVCLGYAVLKFSSFYLLIERFWPELFQVSFVSHFFTRIGICSISRPLEVYWTLEIVFFLHLEVTSFRDLKVHSNAR